MVYPQKIQPNTNPTKKSYPRNQLSSFAHGDITMWIWMVTVARAVKALLHLICPSRSIHTSTLQALQTQNRLPPKRTSSSHLPTARGGLFPARAAAQGFAVPRTSPSSVRRRRTSCGGCSHADLRRLCTPKARDTAAAAAQQGHTTQPVFRQSGFGTSFGVRIELDLGACTLYTPVQPISTDVRVSTWAFQIGPETGS